MTPPGYFLQSTSLPSDDALFGGALVFVHAHDGGGAAGHVVNQPYGRPLNELAEFRSAPALPLWWGGPVDEAHLFFLHRRPDLVAGGDALGGGLYWGGDFAAAVAALRSGALSFSDIKVFVGYCGWEAGDLEAELAEGGWDRVPGDAGRLFGGA